MTAPCVDCIVICAVSDPSQTCKECEARWEKEKAEKKTPTSIEYWKRREKQPEGKIDMWRD